MEFKGLFILWKNQFYEEKHALYGGLPCRHPGLWSGKSKKNTSATASATTTSCFDSSGPYTATSAGTTRTTTAAKGEAT